MGRRQKSPTDSKRTVERPETGSVESRCLWLVLPCDDMDENLLQAEPCESLAVVRRVPLRFVGVPDEHCDPGHGRGTLLAEAAEDVAAKALELVEAQGAL